MDWTRILATAGVPEPPGREAVVAAAAALTAAKVAANGGQPLKRAKGSNGRKAPKVGRKAADALGLKGADKRR
jgi:hypothetical protein